MAEPRQPSVDFEAVQSAGKLVHGQVLRTPCTHSRTLSEITGTPVYLKFENLQFTASFKERGALNKLAQLGEAERRAGVLAISAGNHGQAVAYHAQRVGIPATVVMPRNTPYVKVKHTRGHGARVILHGETLLEAAAAARELREREGLTFVHPFDDPLIIAGQGTVALEMLEQQPDIDCLLIPTGGGGLLSGMAVAARHLKPSIRIIGAETEFYPSLQAALAGVEKPCGGDTLAEGIAVAELGRHTVPLVRQHVDEILLVDEEHLERGVSLLLNVEKTLVEGAGAAGLAAMLQHPGVFQGLRVGIVLSGGNIDARLLAAILMRELVREGRLQRLRIAVSDVPGELARISQVVADAGANFIEIQHQRIFSRLPAKDTYIDVVLETRDRAHRDTVLAQLRETGYVVEALDPDAPG